MLVENKHILKIVHTSYVRMSHAYTYVHIGATFRKIALANCVHKLCVFV